MHIYSDLTTRFRTISQLRRRQLDAPTEVSLAHDLGALCFWAAEATPDPERARPLWEDAIANYAMTLESDDYWTSWVAARGRAYGEGISGEARAAACQAIIERIQHALALWDQACHETNAQTGTAGELLPETSDESSLELAFQLELKAARLVRLAGGLAAGDDQRRICCGPLMARKLGLTAQIGELAQRAPEPDEGLGRLLDMLRQFMMQDGTSPPDLLDSRSRRRLLICFSQLGPAAVLLDRGDPQKALAALRRARCPRCGSQSIPAQSSVKAEALPLVCRGDCARFAELNPAYAELPARGDLLFRHAVELMAEAHMALAEQRIRAEPPDATGAVCHWQEALDAAAAIGIEGRFRDALADMVVGRAVGLEQKRRLDDAIALLTAAQDLGGHERLSGKLAELLTDRGVKAGNEKRWDAAAADLRRALQVNPHVPRTRNNLVIALRGAAATHFHAGQPLLSRPYLEEAVQVLEAGLEMDDANEEWQHDLFEVRMELSAVGGGPAAGPLGDAFKLLDELLGTAMAASSDASKAEAMRLLAEAADKAAAKDYEAALALTERGLELDPESPLLLRGLSSMINNRGVQLAEEERYDEAIALLERGLQRFPDDEALQRNLRQIRQAREMQQALAGGSPLDRLNALLGMLTSMQGEEDDGRPARPALPADPSQRRAAELAERGRDKARRQDYAAAIADLEEALKLAPQDAQLRRELVEAMEKHADALIAAGQRDEGLAMARRGLVYIPDHAGLQATIATAQFMDRSAREGAASAFASLMADLARATGAGGSNTPPYKSGPAEPRALEAIKGHLNETGLRYLELSNGCYSLAFRTEHRGRIVAQLQVVGDLAIVAAPVGVAEADEPDVLYSLLKATHEADIYKVCRGPNGDLLLAAEAPAALLDAKRLESLVRGAIDILDVPDADMRAADRMTVHVKSAKAARAMQERLAGGRGLLDLLRGGGESEEAARQVPEFSKRMQVSCEALDRTHFRLKLGWAEWTIVVFCRGKAVSFMGTLGDMIPTKGNLRFYRRMAELNAQMDVCKMALDSGEHVTFLYELPALDEKAFRQMCERLEDYIVRHGMELMLLM